MLWYVSESIDGLCVSRKPTNFRTAIAPFANSAAITTDLLLAIYYVPVRLSLSPCAHEGPHRTVTGRLLRRFCVSGAYAYSMHTDDGFDVDVAVVGGGPAGLTAALYTTRLGLDTLVIDRGGGRAAMMLDTHNVIGVREDVSGNEFLATAREQVEEYGGAFRRGFVEDATPIDADDPGAGFRLETDDGDLLAKRVVLATGFSDARPDPPLPRTGKGLHWCLHCDAYMFVAGPHHEHRLVDEHVGVTV